MKSPSFDEVSRAFSEHRGGDVPAAIAACQEASAWWRDLERLRALGEALPVRVPTSEEAIRLEAELLEAARRAGAPTRKRPRPSAPIAVVFAGALAATAAATALVLHTVSRDLPTAQRGPLEVLGDTGSPSALVRRASEGADFEHYTIAHHAESEALEGRSASSRSEVVRLRSGKLTIDVPPLEASTRLRLIAPDAELELFEGRVEVEVVHGRLATLTVLAGRAELRRPDAAALILDQGDRWHPVRPPAATPGASSPRAPPLPRPARARAPKDHAAPSRGDAVAEALPQAAIRDTLRPDEEAFGEAWRLLEREQYLAAAKAFRDVGTGPLAEEASYWRVVALDRGGRPIEAEAAMRAYLGSFPNSAREAEVLVLLGVLLLERADRTEAFQLLDRATVVASDERLRRAASDARRRAAELP